MMHLSNLLGIVGVCAASVAAQDAISFGNTSFIAPATVGQAWPISFTAGDGTPVTIAFGNATWAFTIIGKREDSQC